MPFEIAFDDINAARKWSGHGVTAFWCLQNLKHLNGNMCYHHIDEAPIENDRADRALEPLHMRFFQRNFSHAQALPQAARLSSI